MKRALPGIILVLLFDMVALSVADSQQSRIVNNPAPNQGITLRLSDQPVIKVGGPNDDAKLEIISVSWAEINSRGQLAVAPRAGPPSGCASEIRVFDNNSKFLRTIGRAGQGPGEFSCITTFRILHGDSLAIQDRGSRITITDSVGKVAAIANVGGSGTVICCFGDGSYLFTSLRRSGRGMENRPSVPYVVKSVHGDTTSRRSVTLTWGDSTMRIPDGARGSVRLPPMPFARVTLVDVSESEIVYGLGDSYEYSVFAKDGRLLRTVRAALRSTPVTAADIDRWRGNFLQAGRTLGMENDFRNAADNVRMPASMPAYSDIRVERDGAVWLRSYSPLSNPTATDYWWSKFDRNGLLVGTLIIPPTMSLVQFSNGHAILRKQDSATGAWFVYVYEIGKK